MALRLWFLLASERITSSDYKETEFKLLPALLMPKEISFPRCWELLLALLATISQ